MTGDSAERRRVVVVDLTNKRTATPDVLLERNRRCGAPTAIRRQHERKAVRLIAHVIRGVRLCVERLVRVQAGHEVIELSIQRRAASIGSDKAEQDETEIAVDGPRSRLIAQAHRADIVLEFASPLRRLVDEPCGEPGSMLEKIADSHQFAILAAPL